MAYARLLYELADGVATIVLNRPNKLNALDEQAYDELREVFARAGAEDAAGVVGHAFREGPVMTWRTSGTGRLKSFMTPTNERRLGDVRQTGYVVSLLDVARFFVARGLRLVDFRDRGEPSNPELSVPLAQSGAIQIELIQQHDEEPSSVYRVPRGRRTRRPSNRVLDTAVHREFAACEAHGITVVQSGRSVGGGANERFVYFAPRTGRTCSSSSAWSCARRRLAEARRRRRDGLGGDRPRTPGTAWTMD